MCFHPGMQRQVAGIKSALDPRADRDQIAALKLRAIAARRFMLSLGAQQRIRLHYGAMTSAVEILTLLYGRWLSLDPARPGWESRDRFVLSKGHAAPALYTTLCQEGYFPASEFERFRQLGSRLQGHPDRSKTPGVDCSTGSLGQGFPVACGMGLASRMEGAPWKAYACISDGECNEGSTWEAAMIAANLGIDRVVALVDVNGKSSYGSMRGRNDVEPLGEKWRAFNWKTFECDGHDFAALSVALAEAEAVRGRPAVVLCRTVKGKGIPWAERNDARSNYLLEEAHCAEALTALDAQEEELRRA
jgi:transketolase